MKTTRGLRYQYSGLVFVNAWLGSHTPQLLLAPAYFCEDLAVPLTTPHMPENYIVNEELTGNIEMPNGENFPTYSMIDEVFVKLDGFRFALLLQQQ